MQLQITARHIDLTPALSENVRKKLERAGRYFDKIIWASAILQVEKHRHLAELVVHTPGNTFRVQGEAGDLYSAVDLAAHKLDLHMSRLKDKKRHHRKKGRTPQIALGSGKKPLPFQAGKPMRSELSSFSLTRMQEEKPALISEIKRVKLQSQSLDQVLRELNSNGLPFSLFLNERTNQLNLVYKKAKGSYGLLQIF